MSIVALQQPERHIARLTGDTQQRFPPFELTRHHFAHPVPAQEGFFQTAMILQTSLRKLRRRDLGKIQAERRAQRGGLTLGEAIQGEQTLDGTLSHSAYWLSCSCAATRIVSPLMWNRSSACAAGAGVTSVRRVRCTGSAAALLAGGHDRHNHPFLRRFLSTPTGWGEQEAQRLSGFDTRALTQPIQRCQGSDCGLMTLRNGESVSPGRTR